jgi:hypothetical protein
VSPFQVGQLLVFVAGAEVMMWIATEYRDLPEAQASLGVFLEKVYNPKCLHSALG